MDRRGRARGIRCLAPRRRRRASLNRLDIYDVEFGERRPGVILTRDSAIPLLASVTLAGITGTVRGLVTEVPLDQRHGLNRESVINCDNVFTVSKAALGRRRGRLDPEAAARLRAALMIALGLDD